MAGASLKTNWKDTGLVPTTDLVAWNAWRESDAQDGYAPDLSNQGANLVQVTNPPVIVENVLNGQPAWYFNGSRNPLVYPLNKTIQHMFVLGAAEGSAFDQYRGLVNGTSAVDWLVSENTGTKIFSAGVEYSYKKSSVAYAAGNQQAPMGLVPELMEVTRTSAITTPGIQVGLHYFDSARKWKGYFIELLAYSTIQTGQNLERIYLYFNIKFGQHKKGLPFYFPSDDIITNRRRRFYAEPPDKKKVTDMYEYEDGGKDFNTVSDDAPRRWEYEYHLVNRGASTDPPEVAIFDEFWEQAGIHVPFTFRDKHGTEWPNVRVEDYRRRHRDYKPWDQDVEFRLIKYP